VRPQCEYAHVSCSTPRQWQSFPTVNTPSVDQQQVAAAAQIERQSDRYGKSHILADTAEMEVGLGGVNLAPAAKALDVATGGGHAAVISRAVAGGSRKGRCSHLARMFVLLACMDRACNRRSGEASGGVPGAHGVDQTSYGKERIAEPSTTGPGQCHSGCRRTPLATVRCGRSIIVGHTMSTDSEPWRAL